jgi:hypothetical protein
VQNPLRQWTVAMLGVAALAFCVSARAAFDPGSPGQPHTFSTGVDGYTGYVGADMRIRLEGYDRSVQDPEAHSSDWADSKYLRIRTRVWMGVTSDWMKLNLRLVNRSQYFTSRPGPNNYGPATWEFPDEAILDLANVQFPNIADSDWTVTIGRQEFALGNGMVLLEGTPLDQGRTVYFDGITAVWTGTEKDILKLFAFYNKYKDQFCFINDQDRPLRRGDIFVAGADWTHTFDTWLKTEAYYFGADVDDDTSDTPGDNDAEIHTAGARVFGSPHKQVDYSLEVAQEFGERDPEGCSDVDLTGMMVDARLTLKAPEGTRFSPSVLLEYTYFSGDDPDSADEFEGWDPLLDSYPIYREELLPVMLRSNWTNLHQYRIQGNLAVNKCWSVSAAYAYLRADEGDLACNAGGGSGDTFGHLVSAFVDYKPLPWLSFALEVAEFFPGNYWADNADNGTWGRFQTIVTW